MLKKELHCKLPHGFNDIRGSIQTLIHDHQGSVVVITSVPHVERANHYHKEDYHYCYVVSGSITYFERPAGSTEMPKKSVFSSGEMFYTPPMMEHCMHFSEPTIFVTLGGGSRQQNEYENDLVRIESLKQIYDNYVAKQ
jgi:dTDP-4-dehydrorhamnose 3,5-epimerase-like enzyme